MFLKQYVQVKGDKLKKSQLVNKVLNIIYSSCPEGGAFVKFQNGRYWSVNERSAREKIGALFRDLAGDHYCSSSKNKVARKRMKRASKDKVDVDDSSATMSTLTCSETSCYDY